MSVREDSVLFVSHTDTPEPGLGAFGLPVGPSSDLESLYIGPLRKVFSSVAVYDMGEDYLHLGVGAANRRLIETVAHVRPRYLVWHAKMYELLEETLDHIRSEGVEVIGWFSDDEVRFDDYTRLWLPHLDCSFTADRGAMDKYVAVGARSVFFMWGSNPDVFRPADGSLEYDVTFVGRDFGDRGRFVHGLMDLGIDVRAFGHGWPVGYVSTPDMVRIYGTSRINLCFVQSYVPGAPLQVKGRIFDVCMTGGLLLCEYVPTLEDYFDIGKEIVCFTTLEEAAERIRYLLAHEDDRAAIARAGHERALAEHTQEARWHRAFDVLDALGPSVAAAAPPPPVCPAKAGQFHLRWARYLAASGWSWRRWSEELRLALRYAPENPEARSLCWTLRAPRAMRDAAFAAAVRACELRRRAGRSVAASPRLCRLRDRLRRRHRGGRP